MEPPPSPTARTSHQPSTGKIVPLSPSQTRKHYCGNICDPQMFSRLHTRGKIVAETKFASGEAKMSPIKFRKISCFRSVIFLRKHCFPVFAHLGKHGEALAGNNVSATIFPSLPKALLYYAATPTGLVLNKPKNRRYTVRQWAARNNENLPGGDGRVAHVQATEKALSKLPA